MEQKRIFESRQPVRRRSSQRFVRSRILWHLVLLLPFFTIVLVRPTCSQARAASGEDSSDEAKKKAVLAVESQLNQALLKADTATLGRIYADDFAYTNAGGELMSKVQVLNDFRSARIKLLTLGRGDVRLYVFGNTVVLNGISTAALEYKGRISKGPRRFTNVYVNQDGKWRLVAHSVSNFPKS